MELRDEYELLVKWSPPQHILCFQRTQVAPGPGTSLEVIRLATNSKLLADEHPPRSSERIEIDEASHDIKFTHLSSTLSPSVAVSYAEIRWIKHIDFRKIV